MNISDFPKHLTSYPPAGTIFTGRVDKPEYAAEYSTVEKKPELIKSEKEKFALECEKKPWLKGLRYDDILGRDLYDFDRMRVISHGLSDAQSAYNEFMTDLASDHPELARKKFGFTIGATAEVVILDSEGNLSAKEIDILTESMNNSFKLKSLLQHSAECIIALAEYTPANYGGYRQLGIENFHEIIDFRKVLTSGVEDLLEEVFQQVRSKAEERDPPPISVFA